ncbi:MULTISPECIES: DUF2267 domain-containing protein [Sorangium]|uniref:DUF2267 domain-containing protein n=1 Tax=Sorangium cellulosum TaxID=56 RepID=A0A4P2R2Q5_SORCE|nr:MULTISPECIES: DUF2267 domain-containing protein [Sorangium]AUX36966.1 hypothetical protein SOCE836_091850 [Sorangium cellulosum]WCQ96260.1 hypothetical protein NQZ70_09045 [Sorangium sp. Soce836]
MDYERFVEEVQRRAGFEGRDEAERAIAATARTLGERLLEREAAAVAGGLPGPVAVAVRGAAYQGDFDRDELYDRVARREGAPRGFGMEHAQAVCQVVGEALPEAERLRLQRHLADWADLFTPRAAGAPPPRPVHAPAPPEVGHGSTLATGRPGSRHPLSEAHPATAHAGSVARSDEPHAETKLSSSRGLTQERLGDTLAEGRPGPERPVSETQR